MGVGQLIRNVITTETDPTVANFTKSLTSNNTILTAVNAASGTISASVLPSYVDDVLNFATLQGFPAVGETGKIYVTEDNNKTYRWTGTVYVEISSAATADTALKLTNARTISTTGDATYSVSFDGSANVSSAITLANTGVAAGTYNALATQVRPFTVDAKGRITGVGTPVDITPPWSAITGKPTTLNGYGITDALNLAGGNVTGNLGLGVSSPTVKLSIGRLGGAFSVPTLSANTAALITAGGGVAASGSFLSILGGNTSQVAVTFGDSDAAEQGGIYYNNSTDTLDLRAGNSSRISISSGTTTFLSTTTSTSTTTGAICAASLGITGAIFAGSLNGNGSGLTSLNASNISTGTLSADRLPDSGVTAGTYNNSATQVRPFSIDVKGRITSIGVPVNITPPWSAITGKPTTLSGFGITDAQPLGNELTAIQALSDTPGFLKKTGDGSYSIDSNTYLPTSNEVNKYISTFRKTGTTNPAINLEDGEINIPDYSSLGISPSVSPNTVAVLGSAGTNIGGCSLSGFSSNSSEMALSLSGYSGKTTATENAVVILNAAKHSGTTTIAALASNDIAFDFRNSNTTIVRIFGNGNINANGGITAPFFSVGNNQVVSDRKTGWAAPTGTATRTTFATSTVTLSQLAERVKALIDDLTTHGLIGA